jgi:hypothetical protein
MPSETVNETLARRHPALAARAGTSRAAAVRLYCTECYGGSMREARTCSVTECWLWPHAWPAARQAAQNGRFRDRHAEEGHGVGVRDGVDVPGRGDGR